MVIRYVKFFLLVILLVVSVSFISAEWIDCWSYSNTNNVTCMAADSGCVWSLPVDDPWCESEWNPNGCCKQKGCWDYDGTDSFTCVANDGTMNCTWDPWMTMWYPNGSQAPAGGCMTDYNSGNMTWSGMSEGCWNYDGDKASCTSGNNA